MRCRFKSFDDDPKFAILKKVTWTKGAAGDFEVNLRSMLGNVIKGLEYKSVRYIDDFRVAKELQLLQNELESEAKNGSDGYDLVLTYASLSDATKPAEKENIWEGWNPPMNRILPSQGRNGERMRCLLEQLQRIGE